MRPRSTPRSQGILPAPTSSPVSRWRPASPRRKWSASDARNLAAWRAGPPSGIHGSEKPGNETPMNRFVRDQLAALLAATALCAAPAFAADEADQPRGAAVTVFKAAKSCFGNNVELSGTIIAREETQVRPERQGLKVTEVLADAGDTVTARQVLGPL